MQSPFEIFRKHQKMLTVILTGLAMFAFVILGAVPDPANMPPALSVLILACVLGGIGWIAGIRSKKSSEFGIFGLIAGLVLGVVGTVAVGPTNVVTASTGDINQQQLSNLFQERRIANQFVNMAFARARENGASMRQAPPTFGFGHPDDTRDVIVGELLRREADRIGMQTTDESVNDFIRSLSEEKVGASDVREIRNQLGLSETDLYQILKDELKALTMARFLYGGTTLPPETYWDFYRQMNIQQSASIVPLPVDAFVDSKAQPTATELQELFAAHKTNYPNMTTEGRLEEGAPGFRQPRKVKLEYIEIPYEAVEKTVGEVTDKEVEEFYEEFYATAPDMKSPDAGAGNPLGNAPLLPPPTPGTKQPAPPKPESKGESPAKKTPAPAKPAEETKPEPKTDSPAGPPKPAESSKSETPPSDADSSEDAGTPEPQAPAEKPESKTEESNPPVEETEGDDAASLAPRSTLQRVAFYDDSKESEESPANEASQDEPAKDEPTDEEPVKEEPKSDDAAPDQSAADEKDQPEPAKGDAPKKEADKDASPESDKPAEDAKPKDEKEPAEDKPAAESQPAPKGDDPGPEAMKEEGKPADESAPGDDAAPSTTPAAEESDPLKPRELDDELRAEIREQILRRKTIDKMQSLAAATQEYMSQELAYNVTAPEDDKDYLTREQASKKLKAFAKDRGLVYGETPFLSIRDLSQSEEYPIGRAASDTNFQSSRTVAQMVGASGPTERFRAESVLEIESGSRFVYWKIDDAANYEPESLESPGIREQVAQTWRELKARERAEKRAKVLAKQASGVDKPLSEIFAETTVTGKKDAQTVSVIHPPRFSWLSRANPQMSPNPFNRPAPQRTELRTVPGTTGEQFMATVFNDLQKGEVGVTNSVEKDYYYVVRIDERIYGTSDEMQAFRERFIQEPVFGSFGFSDYARLANTELGQYQTNWANELFERHSVDFAELDRQRSKEEPQS